LIKKSGEINMKHKIFIGRVGKSKTTNYDALKSLTTRLKRVVKIEDLREFEIKK
jgi:type IV secretory pathway ATPase VirB11/archaellum biosynthesis ATPase